MECVRYDEFTRLCCIRMIDLDAMTYRKENDMDKGFILVNPDRNRIAAVAAKHGLKAIKIGMRLNSGYTPKRCREVAEQFTGKKFKARDYDGMIAAIQEKLDV